MKAITSDAKKTRKKCNLRIQNGFFKLVDLTI